MSKKTVTSSKMQLNAPSLRRTQDLDDASQLKTSFNHIKSKLGDFNEASASPIKSTVKSTVSVSKQGTSKITKTMNTQLGDVDDLMQSVQEMIPSLRKELKVSHQTNSKDHVSPTTRIQQSYETTSYETVTPTLRANVSNNLATGTPSLRRNQVNNFEAGVPSLNNTKTGTASLGEAAKHQPDNARVEPRTTAEPAKPKASEPKTLKPRLLVLNKTPSGQTNRARVVETRPEEPIGNDLPEEAVDNGADRPTET